MNKEMIVNAKIVKWSIKCDPETVDNIVTITLEIRSTEGSAMITYNMPRLSHLFYILDIKDIKDLENAPCIIYIKDGLVKTLGNFMYKYYNFGDTQKHGMQNWMDWEYVKDYFEENKNE